MEEDGRFHLGPAPFILAARANKLAALSVDHRFVVDLNRILGCNVLVGVRVGDAIVFIDRVGAVVAIERYRVENDITDRRTAIGPEPNEYGRALDWYRVNDAVGAALDTLDPSRRAVHVAVQTVEAPALGIEL